MSSRRSSVGLTVGWPYAPAAGWIVAAVVYLTWTWLLVGPMDADATEQHATSHGDDDSTPRMVDVIVLLASIASLAGVGYLLVAESTQGGDVAAAVVGILSVAASWFDGAHRRSCCATPGCTTPATQGGIDFHQDGHRPDYGDFAYLAFTLGMTYQVSDTDLVDRRDPHDGAASRRCCRSCSARSSWRSPSTWSPAWSTSAS